LLKLSSNQQVTGKKGDNNASYEFSIVSSVSSMALSCTVIAILVVVCENYKFWNFSYLYMAFPIAGDCTGTGVWPWSLAWENFLALTGLSFSIQHKQWTDRQVSKSPTMLQYNAV